MTNPYSDHKGLDGLIRIFSQDVDESELIWHRDHRDRIVTVLEGSGWSVQLDDCMPVALLKGSRVKIPREVFHRLLKGSGDLQLWIVEE